MFLRLLKRRYGIHYTFSVGLKQSYRFFRLFEQEPREWTHVDQRLRTKCHVRSPGF